MNKIAIFNHKGGVSKTTTTFHLAWALSKKGKKVLMVDSDSQCNLTLYSLGYIDYKDFYEKGNKNNINDALRPAYKSQPKYIEPVDCLKIRDDLFLLPGHIDFSENEVQLGVSMQLSETFGTMKNLPGAFNYLLDVTARKYSIDYVIIDMNPSLSAINQNIIFSSDFFLIPTSPDFFSVMSIKSLSKILPSWARWANKARGFFRDAAYPLLDHNPKFIGYTINDFNLSNGRPQKSFKKIMKDISSEISNGLVPELNGSDMLLDKDLYKIAYKKMQEESTGNNINYDNEYCIAEVSNFNKLIALSNQQCVPIFDLDISGEVITYGQSGTLRWFKYLYNAIADRVMRLTKV
jgi:regulatory protein CII